MAGEFELFQSLVRNVQLNAFQVLDAGGKHGRVRACLNKHYYGVDSTSANSKLVGSYGKNTEIRPPSDLDVLFVLPLTTYQRFIARSGNIQSQLLQEVKGVLLKSFPRTDVRADGQVIAVPFTTFAVEVLPVVLLTTGKYWHADANDGGSWKTTDPNAERAHLQESNKVTGKTIHLIKLLKAWKVARGVKIKSFVLEMMAIRFLAQWQHTFYNGLPTNFSFYDWMMRDFFAWMLTQEDTFWTPAGSNDVIFASDTWVAQARFAHAAATRAAEFHTNSLSASARAEWKKIFDTYIP